MRKLSFVLLLALIPAMLYAVDTTQDKFGLGIYFGGPMAGLYLDVPVAQKVNINMMATFTGGYFYAHGDLVWNWRLSDEVQSFKMYLGPGLEFASVNDNHQVYWRHYTWEEGDSWTQVGLRGILGLRISLNRVPLSFNVQLSPVMMLSPGNGVVMSGGAGIRYYF